MKQEVYNHRYPGAILWIFSMQYYVTQLVVANSWKRPPGYSWAHNTISDLANTHCGSYGARLVCSPKHIAMNLSFMLLGATMIAGALLLQRVMATNRMARVGFMCMVVAGIGSLLVGIFPENTISAFHVGGAALCFIFGNTGMLILGAVLRILPRPLRFYTFASGLIGIAALFCFMTHTYGGLGIGGMERIVAYPQSVWMIVMGVYLVFAKKTMV
jgi:hypothetical membrane protein